MDPHIGECIMYLFTIWWVVMIVVALVVFIGCGFQSQKCNEEINPEAIALLILASIFWPVSLAVGCIILFVVGLFHFGKWLARTIN